MAVHERARLLADAKLTVVPAGAIFAAVGEPLATAFFPESGVFAYVKEMTTGHRLAVAAVGVEGLIGASSIVGVSRHPHRIVALLASEGYRIPAATLRRAFDDLNGVRAATLAHIGRQLVEISSLVACVGIHSLRQRLARWLLMTMDKAQDSTLHLTHDELTQMVGGPRPAVTVALSELRATGAIAHLRGRIDILDRRRLSGHACECYVPLCISVD